MHEKYRFSCGKCHDLSVILYLPFVYPYLHFDLDEVLKGY